MSFTRKRNPRVCKEGGCSLTWNVKYRSTIFKHELYIALLPKYKESSIPSQSTYAMNPYGKGGKARLSFSR